MSSTGLEAAATTAGGRITDAEFALLRDLIYRHSGILLGRMKRALVVSRLTRRLKAVGVSTFGQYYGYLVEGADPAELQRMLDCIVTNETRFFREPRQFEFLAEAVCPSWRRLADEGRRPRRVRAWSAACSTGEEAYSVAMTLLSHLPETEGWEVEVLGTDISERALGAAAAGVWRRDRVDAVPQPLLTRFMLRGVRQQQGMVAVGRKLRSVVRFLRLNLDAGEYPPVGRFDLILCRNVLIYFDERSKAGVLDRLTEHLTPDGYLLLGHVERPGSALEHLNRLEATIYQSGGDRAV